MRTITLFRRDELAFFVYGFAKSGRANLSRNELEAFRLLADEMLGMTSTSLALAVTTGTITGVICDD